MSGPRRPCVLRLPEALVTRMEEAPGGIKHVLSRVEKEFGLSSTYAYIGGKTYSIMGPSPDILELAVETLQRRYFCHEERESVVSGELEYGQRAVWKLQGEYATKASHMFRSELEQLRKLHGVHVSAAPMKLEITAGYDTVEEVKARIEDLQSQIDGLYEQDLDLTGTHAELVRLRQFVKRKNTYDFTVVCIPQEQNQRLTVYGRTEGAVKKVIDEWAMAGRSRSTSPVKMAVSPTFSYSSANTHPRFKNEMKIPCGIVRKLEKQRCEMNYIVTQIEREFGLKVAYVRKKHMTIYGPNSDVLEMAAQTLVHRFVLTSPLQNGVQGLLQGKNAIWRFVGTYAKKVVHLFPKELKRIERIRTVSLKFHPSRLSPVAVEILCSVRVIEIVKVDVERVVGQLHNLFEHKIYVGPEHDPSSRVKQAINANNSSHETLSIYDHNTGHVYVYGRDQILVMQVVSELQGEKHRASIKDVATSDCGNMYRQMFQTKVPDHIVRALEQTPGGVMPLVTRIEKEYGVRTLYRKNKHMVLVSPSVEVLELAQDTLAERFTREPTQDNLGQEVKKKKHPLRLNANENPSEMDTNDITMNGHIETLDDDEQAHSSAVNENNEDHIPVENDHSVGYENNETHSKGFLPRVHAANLKARAPVHRAVRTLPLDGTDTHSTTQIPVLEIKNRHSLTLRRPHIRHSTPLSPPGSRMNATKTTDICPEIVNNSVPHRVLRSNLKSSHSKSNDGSAKAKSVSFSG